MRELVLQVHDEELREKEFIRHNRMSRTDFGGNREPDKVIMPNLYLGLVENSFREPILKSIIGCIKYDSPAPYIDLTEVSDVRDLSIYDDAPYTYNLLRFEIKERFEVKDDVMTIRRMIPIYNLDDIERYFDTFDIQMSV